MAEMGPHPCACGVCETDPLYHERPTPAERFWHKLPTLDEHPRINMRKITNGACLRVDGACSAVLCRYHTSEPWRKSAEHRNFGQAEPCALKLAERGGMTLEEVGRIIGRTRERVRQIQETAQRKVALELRRSGWKGDDVKQVLAAAITEE